MRIASVLLALPLLALPACNQPAPTSQSGVATEPASYEAWRQWAWKQHKDKTIDTVVQEFGPATKIERYPDGATHYLSFKYDKTLKDAATGQSKQYRTVVFEYVPSGLYAVTLRD